jgi:cell division protein FtsN
MAKMNGKKHVGNSSSLSKQLLLVLISFTLGYLTASLFDATSLSAWVNKQLLAQQNAKPTDKPASQLAHLPPPKYEFYTLLTSDHHTVVKQPVQTAPATPVVATAPATAANATTASIPVLAIAQTAQPAQTTAKPAQIAKVTPEVRVVAAKPVRLAGLKNRNAYYVQVAAFKSTQEAERMKASLVMKGFNVTISMMQQNKANWYRVSLGPFGSLGLAQNAQSAIARREHITGMVRQLDA